MIEFERLVGEDFGCFANVEMALSKQGLVLIQGENRDTTAADSNGSGKSTLFKMLSWVLFGRTVDEIKGDTVIRAGQKRARVAIDFRVEGRGFTAERTKTRNKPETLKVYYTKNKKSLGARTLKEAQALLEETLSLDWLAFKNTVLYGQGDILHFADPRTTDVQRKAVLTKILRLERIDTARAEARRLKNLAVANQSKIEGELIGIESQLEMLDTADLVDLSRVWERARKERITAAQEDVDETRADLSEVAKANKSLKKLRRTLKGVQEILDEFTMEEAAKDPLVDQLNEIQNSMTHGHYELQTNQRARDELAERLDRFSSGECSECGAPSDSPSMKTMAEAAQNDHQTAQAACEATERALEEARAEKADLEAQVAAIEESVKDRDDWADKWAMIMDRIREAEAVAGREDVLERSLERLEGDLERATSEENPHKLKIAEWTKKAAALRGEVDEKTAEAALSQQEAGVYAFWVEGFGPAGLPSYLMDSVVPVVAAQANKYLEILSDGDLKIKLDTLTTLKGGGVREKLNFTTTVEGQEDVPMSGGQLKKVTLATDLALMDLLSKREGAAVDLLLLDEVLDGLDAAGRSRIMDLLSHLRSQRSTIIVISHDPEIVEKFGKTITVTKKNGIARLAS
jgi:DNA repair exonuclease SbcCD ATPase subunit